MKVLLVAMKYDYGDPERGPSGMGEYFLQPLQRIVDEVREFDFMQCLQERGRSGMNAALLEFVSQWRPDVVLFVPFRDEFSPKVIDRISAVTTTIAYFFDDVWRIGYCRSWSRHFTIATTSDPQGVRRWARRGCRNFVYSPFAVNPRVFRDLALPLKYDVSFVGGHHPYREWMVARLGRAGFKVGVWGHGWPNGRLNVADMVALINQTKINLNLSNNEQCSLRYLFAGGRTWRQALQAWKGVARVLLRRDAKTIEMVKGRHFEITACGGFQLSHPVRGLEEHYAIGKEIAVYHSFDDLVRMIRYYLEHETERAAIARAGYARTLKCHTAELRLTGLLSVVLERRRGNGSRANLAGVGATGNRPTDHAI